MKVYVDILGGIPFIGGHLAPSFWHPAGPYTALWGSTFALGNVTANNLVFGNGPGSMRQVLDYAKAGDRNTAPGGVGLLLCAQGTSPWPTEFAKLCNSSASSP